jgi:hypothetical protein
MVEVRAGSYGHGSRGDGHSLRSGLIQHHLPFYEDVRWYHRVKHVLHAEESMLSMIEDVLFGHNIITDLQVSHMGLCGAIEVNELGLGEVCNHGPPLLSFLQICNLRPHLHPSHFGGLLYILGYDLHKALEEL